MQQEKSNEKQKFGGELVSMGNGYQGRASRTGHQHWWANQLMWVTVRRGGQIWRATGRIGNSRLTWATGECGELVLTGNSFHGRA